MTLAPPILILPRMTSNLDTTCAAMVAPDTDAAAEAQRRLDGKTKPRRSLGVLEELACRLALGRPPTEDERADAAGFLAAYRAGLIVAGKENPGLTALAAYVRTLFGSNEFLHCD